MKKMLGVFFIFLFLTVSALTLFKIESVLPAFAATKKAEQHYMVTSSSTMLRSGPSAAKSQVVKQKRGLVLKGIQEHKTRKGELWYKLRTTGGKTGWTPAKNVQKLKRRILSAPLISQMPELPRGCEVTSLAMMLQYAGKKADKMTLAKQVKKDPTPYKKVGSKVYFGNPYNGFVGNMYTFSKPGYGVYHGPIAELASSYLGKDRVIDLTGQEFETMLDYINRGTPVWVIANTAYKQLPSSSFRTFHTPTGPVRITYKEHSVLVTGYDNVYVYFNDPLKKVKNKRVLKSEFKKAWNQMGKQAITYN